jgi:hypothetical protein
MSPENGQLQSRQNTANLAEHSPHGTGTKAPLLSRAWLIIGSVALLLGLVMGFVMSSLGK